MNESVGNGQPQRTYLNQTEDIFSKSQVESTRLVKKIGSQMKPIAVLLIFGSID